MFILFRYRNFCLLFAFLYLQLWARAEDFPVVTPHAKATILYDKAAPAIDSITAYLLAADIERLTNYHPQVITDFSKAKGNTIVIGSIQSSLVQKFISKQSSLYKNLI